ncbi:MAG: energy-coupled thiamine transporter ThiT [Erysipelotrichales bacterium]
MKTRNMVFIAIISALALLLSLLTFFQMPNGGSVTLYLVPLFIAAFNKDIKTNIFIAIVTATLQVMTGYFLNPLQVILDYYFPVMMLCCCKMFKVNEYFDVLVAGILALLSYTISGMIFFKLTFIPSMTYNAIHFIPTIIICYIIYRIVNKALKKSNIY